MKLSIAIPVWDASDKRAMFSVPKGFRFVYYNHTQSAKIYYRWPLNYGVSLYIKLYYWYLVNIYAKLKKTSIKRRK